MAISYATPAPERIDEAIAAGELPFGDVAQPDDVAYFKAVVEPERVVVAEDGGQIVGVGASLSNDVSVPGGARLPMCTVGLLSVLPTHRRRGVARELVDRLHRQAHERGEAAAGLVASESRIYGNFGYGIATHRLDFEIVKPHALLRDQPDIAGRVRFVEPARAAAILNDSLAALGRTVPGIVGGTDNRVAERFARDPEHWRGGAGSRMLVAYEDRGVLAYRIKQAWELTGPAHTLVVEDLVAVDDEALLGLWAYCFGVDLVGAVKAWLRPVDEPLVHWLTDPRRLAAKVSDMLWLRLLDVPAALTARTYEADGAWTVEVPDGTGPAGETYRLEVDGGVGSAQRALDAPDMTVPVDSLAAAYLGGTRLADLARAGRAREHTPGALRSLDRALAWARQPWLPFEI